MHTRSEHSRLALAQRKFDPLAHVLDRLSREIEKEYGRSAALKPRSSIQQTAGNVYEVS